MLAGGRYWVPKAASWALAAWYPILLKMVTNFWLGGHLLLANHHLPNAGHQLLPDGHPLLFAGHPLTAGAQQGAPPSAGALQGIY